MSKIKINPKLLNELCDTWLAADPENRSQVPFPRTEIEKVLERYSSKPDEELVARLVRVAYCKCFIPTFDNEKAREDELRKRFNEELLGVSPVKPSE